MVLFQNKVNIRSDQKITCNQIYITTAQILRKNVSLKIEYNFYDEYKYFGQDTLRCNWPEKYLYSENVKQK